MIDLANKIFYLDEYISSLNIDKDINSRPNRVKKFSDICNDVLMYFNTVIFEKELRGDDIKILERQKKLLLVKKMRLIILKVKLKII